MVNRMSPDPTTAKIQPESFWGVGPRIGFVTAIHFALTLAIDRITTPLFQITALSVPAAVIIGMTLIIIGLLLYLLTLSALLRARRENQLITTGPYRLVRHPLYTIAIAFFCPGFCVMFRSWLVLTTVIAQAVALRIFIGREEQPLLATFGHAYEAYRRKTPAIIPFTKPVRD